MAVWVVLPGSDCNYQIVLLLVRGRETIHLNPSGFNIRGTAPTREISHPLGATLPKFLLFLPMAALFVLGCNPAPKDLKGIPAPASLILISIDTLRADFVGSYGNNEGWTPFLDTFAEEGILFENCYSQSAQTLPSHASLMTSRYYHCHQASQDPDASFWLSEEELTLAEVLSARGFATGASTDGGFVSARFGFGQGFDSYQEPDVGQKGKDGTNPTEGIVQVNRRALQWLDQVPAEEPFFLFLHYYDVHNFIRDVTGGLPTKRALMKGLMEPRPALIAAMRAAYATRLRYLDGQLRVFFDALRQRHRLASSFVVISSDHGEGFGEHGWFGHGSHLHQEAIWVPLLLQGPDLPQGVRIREPVQNIDIFPTVLELLGVGLPEGIQGHSMLPVLFELEPEPRLAISEVDEPSGSRCLVSSTKKLFWYPAGEPQLQLVDLSVDPMEVGNLADEQSPLALELRQRLLEGIDCQGRLADAEKVLRRPLSPEERESLEAIGYLQ